MSDEHAREIAERGYTIVEGVLDDETCEAIAAELARLEEVLAIQPANNPFEGTKTLRIYNLLAHGELFRRIPIHERVLPIVDEVLGSGALISSLSSIAILPGEAGQPIHADDQLIPLKKPHRAIICNTMWAITDFTRENGATRIIPGSHLRDGSPKPFQHCEGVIPAEMSRGSVMVYHGSLWHGGGPNKTDSRRIGVAMNYCAGYIRQQENQQLGLSRELVAQFPTRLKELVGYGVFRGVIGHINRKNPIGLLDPEADDSLPWAT